MEDKKWLVKCGERNKDSLRKLLSEVLGYQFNGEMYYRYYYGIFDGRVVVFTRLGVEMGELWQYVTSMAGVRRMYE